MPRRLLYNRRHYEEAKNYGDQLWTPQEQHRLETICSFVPEETGTILDIGSGGGEIVQALRDREYWTVATDCSSAAMSRYGGERVLCDCMDLPFPAGLFDFVTCTEVLEHLDQERMDATLHEIARVVRSYVLISVPNSEDLNQSMAKCDACGHCYTIYGHVRTFVPEAMDRLMPGFEVIKTAVGDEDVGYNRLLLWVRQRIGGRWTYWDCAVCPVCGRHPPPRPGKRGVVALGCDFLNNRIPWHPRRKTPLYVLYRRTRSFSASDQPLEEW
ncbi:MAG TPA: class I SAM-dependent methyltransferase [Phycisphaerae bacterium]|nr:class I SAM-dependent methyltransferase [Phycisphaerae bacterium]